jgi:hypothetical protein
VNPNGGAHRPSVPTRCQVRNGHGAITSCLQQSSCQSPGRSGHEAARQPGFQPHRLTVSEGHTSDDLPVPAARYLGGARPVVLIEEGQDFETSDCGDWQRVNQQRLMDNADPASTVEDGIWTVGLDIRAGTYRPTEPAGEECYWAILEGRTNGTNILNNGLGGGRPTVTVERGQQFEVALCGTWERQ